MRARVPDRDQEKMNLCKINIQVIILGLKGYKLIVQPFREFFFHRIKLNKRSEF